MFKTVEQVEKFMSEFGYHRNPETGWIENEEGMCNAYCHALWEKDHWSTIPGINLTEEEALDKLKRLVELLPHKTILMERSNDLEEYAKVYVPGRGIISYSEYENNR